MSYYENKENVGRSKAVEMFGSCIDFKFSQGRYDNYDFSGIDKRDDNHLYEGEIKAFLGTYKRNSDKYP